MANLRINRGTTFSITVNYLKNGVATSLVGATVRFTMKTTEWDDDLDDSEAALYKDVTTGDADGVAEITLAPSDTSGLEPGEYRYDIKVDEASDGVSVFKIDEGKVKLDGSPTNRLV